MLGGIVILVLVVGAGFLYIARQPQETKDTKDTHSLLQSLEDHINGIKQDARTATQEVNVSVDDLEGGVVNTVELYDAVREAETATANAYDSLRVISVPSELTEEVSGMVHESIMFMIEGYRSFSKGYSHLLEFLDNQTPAELEAYRQHMHEAGIAIMKGDVLFMEAKQAADVPLTDQEQEIINVYGGFRR